MTRKTILSLVPLLLLAACVKASLKPMPDTPVIFMTAALPATKPALALPTLVASKTAPTLGPADPSAMPSCSDAALLVADVTYPDQARLNAGEKFTKTWRLQNTGNCTWTGYTAAFISGDKMDAPDSLAVSQTNANSSVEVSVDLVAPISDGAFTGIFELRDAAGNVVPIGRERSFWVKIIVGNGSGTASGSEPGVSSAQPVSLAPCQYSENAGYVQQLIALINQARADAQLPALTVNAQLAAAAQAHSVDMACGNYLSHSGPNGEHIGYRLREIGFAGPGFSEIIAIGTPPDAMSQWQNDPGHWEMVMNPNIQQIGVGYAYFASSDYGSYITVNFS